jgi:spermidine synthase
VNTFREALYRDHGQTLSVDKVLYRGATKYQDVLIFTNETFGKVLALDGVVQFTERDNHIYHEMLAHVPLMAHGAPKDVLVIGGGDGGALKEILKHPVGSAVLVELDADVIRLSCKYFPELSEGAFSDARASIVLGDGAAYVSQTDRRFDVIIVDSTDPVGPAEALFSDEFYLHCRSLLRPGGIVSVQTGVPFYRSHELDRMLDRLAECFGSAEPFLAPVPTYAHGLLALIVAGEVASFCPPCEVLRDRFAGVDTKYYSPDVHHAAFVAAPRFGGRTHRKNTSAGQVADASFSDDRRKCPGSIDTCRKAI